MDERTLKYAQEQLRQLRNPALAGREHNELKEEDTVSWQKSKVGIDEMSIHERVKEIRNMADVLHEEKRYAAEEIMRQAADTIEAITHGKEHCRPYKGANGGGRTGENEHGCNVQQQNRSMGNSARSV